MSKSGRFFRVGLWPFLTLLVIGGWIMFSLPWDYNAEAMIQVMGPPISVPGSAENLAFVDARLEVLRSTALLEGIVDELSLASRWNVSRREAVLRLKGVISVNRIAATELGEITVIQPKKSLAIEIANEAIRQFEQIERRRIDAQDAKERARILAPVMNSIREQEEKIARMEHGFSTPPEKLEFEKSHLQELKLRAVAELSGRRIHSESVIIHDPPAVRGSVF